MRIKRNLCLLLSLYSITNATKYAGEPFSFGFGGRALGMGGSYVSVASDPSAIFWNPAGMLSTRGKELLFMHAQYFENLLQLDYLSGVINSSSGENTVWGAALYLLNSSGIKETELIDPQDSIYLENLRIKGELYYRIITLYLSGARRTPRGDIGITLKLIREDLSVIKGTGIGIDIGYKTELKGISLGFSLKDAFTTPVFFTSGRTEYIYPSLDMGLSYSIRGVVLASIDIYLLFEDRETFAPFSLGIASAESRFGFELRPVSPLFLRAGLDRGNLTFGAGILYKNISLDYALLSHTDLGPSHRVSITFQFF